MKTIDKIFPEIHHDESVLGEYYCSLKFKKWRIPGKLYITDQRICFHSLSWTRVRRISIRYEDIDSMRKVDRFLWPLGITILSGNQKIKFIGFLVRESAFRKIQNRIWESLQALTPVKITKRQLSISRESTSDFSDDSIYEFQLNWIPLIKQSCDLDLNDFWNDLQANPIIILPFSRSGINVGSLSKHTVTFQKSKWIPLLELENELCQNLGYKIELEENSEALVDGLTTSVSIIMIVDSVSDSQISLTYEYGFDKRYSPQKLYIKLNVTKESSRNLEFQLDYDLQFGNLTASLSQIRIEKDIEFQIIKHFKQVMEVNQVDYVVNIKNTSLISKIWIPPIKKMELRENILLLIWILVVLGLASSIMVQKILRQSIQ